MSMREMLQEGEYTIADGREIVANAVAMLQEGEYTIADDFRAIVASVKVIVFKRQHRTLKENDFRCRDCVHYHKGQTSTNQESHNFGYICDMNPKEVCNNNSKNQKLYYSALKYGKICDHFERKED